MVRRGCSAGHPRFLRNSELLIDEKLLERCLYQKDQLEAYRDISRRSGLERGFGSQSWEVYLPGRGGGLRQAMPTQ